MSHSQHVMAYLENLRNEALSPATSMKRIVEIFSIVARYAGGIAPRHSVQRVSVK